MALKVFVNSGLRLLAFEQAVQGGKHVWFILWLQFSQNITHRQLGQSTIRKRRGRIILVLHKT
jgi:hypothetical protein